MNNTVDIDQISTEMPNRRTEHIDEMTTLEIVTLINEEDDKVAKAVKAVLPSIAETIDLAVARIRIGGRIIYVGCGTSGRLGILDAAECPPTFSTDPGMVVGIIAGGSDAMVKAVEGAEDNPELAKSDLEDISLHKNDLVIGLAASGRTPYVIGALEYAHSIGCATVGITCSRNSDISKISDVAITPLPGPEVIAGSTRMKSGTAEKMILNMISTGTMIRLGKVYGNLMVDVNPTNEKLINRCISIVQRATGVDAETSQKTLEQCDFRPKTAIVMIKNNMTAAEAKHALNEVDGIVSAAITTKTGSEN